MALADELIREMNRLFQYLIEIGFCSDQNFPAHNGRRGGVQEVGLPRRLHSTISLKNIAYEYLYDELAASNGFSLKLIDGALLILYYKLERNAVTGHRLAFFPSPYLRSFESDPDSYWEDELFADVLEKRAVPFPIRFDYSLENRDRVSHPVCHLTLGQYSGCRIPVSSPLRPRGFIEFIVEHFYNPVFQLDQWNCPNEVVPRLDDCIHQRHLAVPHLVV